MPWLRYRVHDRVLYRGQAATVRFVGMTMWCTDEDEWVEQRVTAWINTQTGDPYRPDTFQLISAGSDGIFGTEDDITNFDRSE